MIDRTVTKGPGEFNAKRHLVEVGSKFLQFLIAKQSQMTGSLTGNQVLALISISTMEDEDPSATTGKDLDLVTDRLDLQILAQYIYTSMDEFTALYSKIQSAETKQMQIHSYCDTITSVLAIVNATRGVPSEYFYLFDKVAYFLMMYRDDILVGSWTEICHQLMRKVPFSRNEDLMFIYR